ncbi:MAG: polynucleotide kinase-phosphatase, partial [Propionibacteriaceae bacterium]|nr:polynucleotide kinase-phosphatase [Propionibacteriaceae bacterium]
KALVVYGHTPTPEIEFINNTVCIDTGCVFGGKLTAYRYPEKEIVQVDALREYYAPVKPFLTQVEPTEELPAPAAAMEPWSVDEDGPVQFSASRYAPLPENPQSTVELLTIKDVLGAHHLSTRLRRTIKIQAENSAAALEVMSRYSADPRWLIYLPPTMSPCETSALPDYLEDPSSGFSHYRNRGVDKVVCEVKHMGSRAVVILCRDEKAAARRFKMDDGSIGIIYTRTGRKFFCDTDEKAMLTRLNTQLESTGFWEDFDTDWVCLDAELMPWSAKAQGLLKDQYAPVGRAGRGGLAASIEAVSAAAQVLHGSLSESAVDLSELLARLHKRADAVDRYVEAYRRYCWDVSSLDDYRLAPFHILATERVTYVHRNHVWHMENIARYITGTDPIFMATDYLVVNLHDDQGIAEATRWWQDITDAGKEGMVIKPFDFISQHGTELVQPAVKVRGREYLRIIYGPEYLIEPNLTALRERSLSRKRSLALNEFALGVESLERFIAGEPLHRIHECVFAILALESEPVDPRL